MKTHLLNLENETTLKKLSQDMHPNALCARVNGRLRELNYKLKGRHEIIFLDLNKTHELIEKLAWTFKFQSESSKEKY